MRENQSILALLERRESTKLAISFASAVEGEEQVALPESNLKDTRCWSSQNFLTIGSGVIHVSMAILYSYIFIVVYTHPFGDCYASSKGNLVPMFESP
jgi:hypothetical protein